MTYEEGILEIPKEFEYQPEIVNKEKLRPFKRVIVCGMGGSRLAADILNMIKPELEIYVHSDFDLPALAKESFEEALVIANSYSGNTAETVSGAKKALEAGYNLAIVSGGGQLIEMATQQGIPHIQIPENEMPARMCVGYDLMALAGILALDADVFKDCSKINAMALESRGKQLAGQLGSDIPLIYTSDRFNALGYIWKIVFNETAKIPAFNNRFPEVDHNEIAGFERVKPAMGLHCLLLKGVTDSRLEHRLNALAALLLDKKIPLTTVSLEGGSVAEQVISSMILAHWTAVEMCIRGGLNPLDSSTIEQFKKQTND